MALFGLALPTWLRDALEELVDASAEEASATRGLTAAVVGNTAAVNRNARAVEALVRAISPKKATSVSLIVQPEPPGSSIKQQEKAAMDTYRLGSGFKATLVFNGVIDEEPQISATGPGSMTQDPKVEIQDPAFPDDPTKKVTSVVLHFRSSLDDPQGIVGISGSVKADELATEEEERVAIDFPAVAAFVSPAAKATAVTISTEGEGA